MWPRIVEMILALWLAASPFVLPGPAGARVALVDWGAAAAVLILAGLSFNPRLRSAHVGTLVVALFLIAWGWTQFTRPGPPGAQNQIIVGLLLGLFAVVPSSASEPPPGWREYVADGDGEV